MFLSVTVSQAQLITTSQPAVRNVLSSVLGGCYISSVFFNDLFVDHRVEMCYETHEEQRDAVLDHLLNGVCFTTRCCLVQISQSQPHINDASFIRRLHFISFCI